MTDGQHQRALGGLQVDASLADFAAKELLPLLGLEPDDFWGRFGTIVASFGPRNEQLLARRDQLQAQLDHWHRQHGGDVDAEEYEQFLGEIGYLDRSRAIEPIDVAGVDPEIASLAGPQLVTPLSNARFALNAANARWGSLYDALYGTDVIPEGSTAERGTTYNPVRGAEVIAWTESFLDEVVPLGRGSYSEVEELTVGDHPPYRLEARLADGSMTGLEAPDGLVGFTVEGTGLGSVVLRHHGLHIEIRIDRSHPIGRDHRAGVADVMLESALTTIQDCEDAVAVVDAEDKAALYRNWLGLTLGTLEDTFEKQGRTVTRQLAPDRTYVGPQGEPVTLSGRSLLLIRNVGLHMMTDMVRTSAGDPVPEGMLDAFFTVAIGRLDLAGTGRYRNSRTGSIYIVKPKLHGPEEVELSVDLFAALERQLDLPENTVKIGIMDEERRTSLNLEACIAAARRRVIFINTGFLDRSGDEIHTWMEAGPVVRKAAMKQARWLAAYEDRNVDVGLLAGLAGSAQIGKGMWTMPDEMKAMVETKIAHPLAGASCAWVPSPTAATLHALHYHRVDVAERQAELRSRPMTPVRDLLVPMLLAERPGPEEIDEELSNNAQGILGYVVRWIDQGVGCSKVPDVHDVALMEDRATLRISSQHIANWLRHGIVSKEQVEQVFARMALVVDRQNADDPTYRPMAGGPAESVAFQAALDLVYAGTDAPNGYTEPILTAGRRRVKGSMAGSAEQAPAE